MSTERTYFVKHGAFAMLAGGAVRGWFVQAAHLQHIHQVIVRQLLRLFPQTRPTAFCILQVFFDPLSLRPHCILLFLQFFDGVQEIVTFLLRSSTIYCCLGNTCGGDIKPSSGRAQGRRRCCAGAASFVVVAGACCHGSEDEADAEGPNNGPLLRKRLRYDVCCPATFVAFSWSPSLWSKLALLTPRTKQANKLPMGM